MLKKIKQYVDDNIGENKECIKSLFAHSLGFQLNGVKNESNSKIGGLPSIEENLLPCLDGEPLTFIGQIALSDISSVNSILPSTGLLLFFVCTEDLEYRYPDKKGEFRVVYIEKVPEVVQVIDEKCQLMSFFQFYTFPSYQESVVEKNNISNDDFNTIEEIQEHILWGLGNDYDAPHQILGHPHAIQGTVRFWWAAIT